MTLENIYRKIILEGSRDNALIPVMQQYGIDMSLSQFKQVMLRKLAGNGLRNLSLGGNFYLLGAIIYYLNGDLTENTPEIFNPNRDENPDKWEDKFKRDVCYRLNALIYILRNHHIDSLGTSWEQPEDFGNLPLNKLLKKYNSKINRVLGISKNKAPIDPSTNAGGNYTFEVITSHEQCKKYGQYTDWCITYSTDAHYNGYTIEARNDFHKKAHFIIFRQNGFENIPEEPEKDKWLPGPHGLPKPQDTFGNSLIAVLQDNQSPEALYITSRWNHGTRIGERLEADYAYTTQEFLNIIGCDKSILKRAYDQWVEAGGDTGDEMPTNSRREKMNLVRDFRYIQMQINNGNIIENIFGEKNILPLVKGKKDRAVTALVLLKKNKDDSDGYITLYDRGKLLYDDFIVKGDDYDIKYGATVENRHSFLDSGIIVLFSNGFNSPIYLYNMSLKRFLNIGGATVFPKYKSGIDWDFRNSRYFPIALSANKIAIVDPKKFEAAVTADNGSPWFESIIETDAEEKKKNRRNANTYLNSIFVDRFVRQYILTYDSASNEKYLFDAVSGKIMNLDKIRENEELYGFGLAGDVIGRVIPGYASVSGYTDANQTNSAFAFVNFSTGKLLNVDGYKFFYNPYVVGSLVSLTPEMSIYGSVYGTFFYDYMADKLVELDGKPLFIKSYYTTMEVVGDEHLEKEREDDSWMKLYLSLKGSYDTMWYVYNPLTQSLLSHNGSYMFKVDYHDRHKGIIQAEDGTQIQLTLPERDAEKHEYAMQQATENIKRNFNIILERMNRYNKIC